VQTLANLLYLFAPPVFLRARLWRWKLLGRSERKIIDEPPVWSLSRDHMLVVLQKSPAEIIDSSNEDRL